ncbi:serine/threonine-protein kinase HipA [Allofrancisella inopinata]|uniref:Type II toxin-antitoxin system HipA family toxin n=1 Tax=Allofrancisella inopinata TaxID=1085647 RepID=A0AAE6YJ52_9GAMM|nr:type II toxin-antitoxin system HipA family toxin [Allofrancisella inopinata]QIV95709.1 type II toxin-antitoxin system HipA family toxin [Allofrancisella inopinata]TDT72167.1 serine/threonine-protein kinase HipA [Allofrancisella inopinata]
MKFTPTKIVYVYYKPQDEKILVGRLAVKSHKLFFEYDVNFLKTGLNLSPFKLPLKAGIIPSEDFTFDGMFGVFNDSLPDGWGRLLLDRALVKHDINPGSLSLLDRLCFVGSHGMGALTYEPETENAPLLSHASLDEIAREICEFQEHDDDSYVEDLLKLGGSSAGARPKILIDIKGEHWLIKFPSSTDPKDIGAIEYAYHLMAQDAGLEVPNAKLFPSTKGLGFFGSKRFDRNDCERIYMHTISGLLHADHRIPSLDYQMIMKTTMYLTRNMNCCEKQYRQCVFNILSHNRDDHAKNFSFLMAKDGSWRMSPSYDLTFSSGPSGEHCSMIMGEGKNPGISHLLELAKINNIKKNVALCIISEVKAAVAKWPEFAQMVGVSNTNTKLINSAIKEIIKENF